jgi:uncharacterized phage protein gp47/JayE
MPLSVEQLISPITKEQSLAAIIELLTSLGFPAGSWQAGSIQRTLIEIYAQQDATRMQTVVDIAKSGFNSLAAADWLDLISESHFQNTRAEGLQTVGALVMTASLSAPGPFPIDTGSNQQIFADKVSGYTYRNISSGTLNAGSSLTVMIQAEQVGAQGDVPINTITIQKTPLAGVTVNNPTYVDPLLGSLGTWITSNGAFPETDDRLRLRNSTKWATLSAIPPRDAYIHFALIGHESVTRASLDAENPRGPGSLDLYIAGINGALSVSVVDAVDDYIRGAIDGISRIPPGGNVLVKTAVNKTVPVRGTVYIERSFNTPTARAAIQLALLSYFQSLSVGGTVVTLGTSGVIVYAQLLRIALAATPGVRNVIFTAPTSSVTLTTGEVAIPSFSLIYTGV